MITPSIDGTASGLLNEIVSDRLYEENGKKVVVANFASITIALTSCCLNSDNTDDVIAGHVASLNQYGVDAVIYVLPDNTKYSWEYATPSYLSAVDAVKYICHWSSSWADIDKIFPSIPAI